jgi:hypothetical protein
MENFLENFYGTIFSPNKTFDKLKDNLPLFQAFLIVLFVSILNSIIHLKFTPEGIIFDLIKIFYTMFGGIISWLFLASFFYVIANIFRQEGKVKEFLTFSGFALIPWIFIGPVELFKTAGIFGQIISVLLGLFIWLWVTILIILSITKAYNLTFGRTLILLITPFVGCFLTFNWIIGFFVTLFRVLNT